MELYKDKGQCCGCQACVANCPKSAIKMTEDEEGFLYPTIDPEKCVKCGICSKTCLFQSQTRIEAIKNTLRNCYAVKHRDIDTRIASRSGGIFTAVSDLVLQQGGVRLRLCYPAINGCNSCKDRK